MNLKFLPATAAIALVLALPTTRAQTTMTTPAPSNVINLSAGATVEVATDWLTVVLSTLREGSDAASVQTQLKQALDAALAEARKLAQPGQVEVRTGHFGLQPRYAPTPPRGASAQAGPQVNGWVGTAELVVEGRDSAAIAALAGRIQSMGVARVGQSLSRQAREKVEADITAQAIQAFRSKADTVSRQFGFGSWALREVNVDSSGSEGPQPRPMMKAMAMRAGGMADEALPVEAGKASVTAHVSGSVQMLK